MTCELRARHLTIHPIPPQLYGRCSPGHFLEGRSQNEAVASKVTGVEPSLDAGGPVAEASRSIGRALRPEAKHSDETRRSIPGCMRENALGEPLNAVAWGQGTPVARAQARVPTDPRLRVASGLRRGARLLTSPGPTTAQRPVEMVARATPPGKGGIQGLDGGVASSRSGRARTSCGLQCFERLLDQLRLRRVAGRRLEPGLEQFLLVLGGSLESPVLDDLANARSGRGNALATFL